MDALAGVVTAYVGPNAAHRELRTALANAKAIAFILIEGDAKVLKAFLQHAEEIKRQSQGRGLRFRSRWPSNQNNIAAGGSPHRR
jgi:sugar phosphate isomerase/epimerase